MLTKKELKTKAYEMYELLKDYNSQDGLDVLKKLKKVYKKESGLTPQRL
ncbi:hypothetical protein [Chryseobacterium binzhouense]|nr:hypothetical protein [Chryseobacterium binzhouense]